MTTNTMYAKEKHSILVGSHVRKKQSYLRVGELLKYDLEHTCLLEHTCFRDSDAG